LRRLVAVFGVALLGACAPRAVVVRESPGIPVDPAPLAERLAAYNAAPTEARLQGKLRAEGQGSAEFGARVRKGVGLRLDAVAGPFSTLVLSLACRVDEGCEVYLPSRRTAYSEPWAAWGPWFETLLLGRVPRAGQPSGALRFPDGGHDLLLEGDGGWREEVSFAGSSQLPERVMLSRWGERRFEIAYGDYTEVGGHPFPGRVALRVAESPTRAEGGYELVFRRVAPDAQIDDGSLTLKLPSGTAVESTEGLATWYQAQIPFWLPVPDG